MKRTINFILFFLLIVPPLIFFTDLTRNPYYFQIVLLNGVTVLLWALWLFGGLKGKELVLRRTPLDLPLWSFFAVASLSWAAALFGNLHHPYLSYGVFSEGAKRWLFLLTNSLMVYYAAVFFVDDDDRQKFLLAALWTGEIAAVYGILQYFSIEFIWPKVLNPFGGRCVSTFGNPNFLSSYLVLLFPVAFVLYLKAGTAGKRNFYLALLVSYFGALLCTLTRSSWGGGMVALGLAAALAWRFEPALFKAKKNLVIAAFCIFALLTVFWPRSTIQGYNPSMMQRITETTEVTKTYYGSWHQRRLIWSCAWHMVKENPVLGKGWGCFELFYPFYQGRHLFLEPYRTFRTHANNSHNEILEIWSQTGTAGFGVYLWFLVTLFATAYFLIKKLQGEKRLLAIGLAASLAGMLADNMLNVSLHFAIPGFLYWWNMGLLVGLAKGEETVLDMKPFVRRCAAAALVVFFGLLIVRYTKTFLGEIHYFNGFKLAKKNDVLRAIPQLEAAHSLQRFEVNNDYELANAYARAGDRDKAIGMYRESLRANAGYDEIYYNMATVLAQKGMFSDAIIEYTRSLYINPLSLEGYSAMATLFLQDPAKYGQAGIAMLSQAALIFPQNRDIWNNIGYLYTKLNRDDEAIAAYKKAVTIDPDFELARRNLAISLRKTGKKDDLLERVDALMRGAEQSILAKNWPAALTQCEQLVQQVPNSFKARLYLANVYFTMGKLDNAIVQYQEAKKFDPRNQAVLGNLGLAYFSAKQYTAAREQLTALLALDPQNQIARQKVQEIDAILTASPPPGRAGL